MIDKQYYVEIYNNYTLGQKPIKAKSIYVNGQFVGVYIPEQFKGVYNYDK